MKWALIGVGIIILVIILAVGGMYLAANNTMVALSQDTSAKWSEVENQYQRQADLIPNLASTVTSATVTETSYVKDVIDARTKWLNASTIAEKDQAGVEMNQSLANFVSAVATAEAYPTLQANKQFSVMMDELTGAQNRIATARGRYIESVQAYNTAIKQIPNSFFAGMLGFTEKTYYSANPNALNTPSVGGNGTLPQ